MGQVLPDVHRICGHGVDILVGSEVGMKKIWCKVFHRKKWWKLYSSGLWCLLCEEYR